MINSSMAELRDIKQPIAKELQQFESHFRSAMKSKVPLLDRIMYYIIRRKGKRMRPMFTFLSAGICGEINSSTYTAASMIELLHTATLVHDDVVDDAYLRRGVFSINALWKNKIAVLVGDYLLSRGLLLAVDNEEFELLRIVSRAVKDMSEGELLQIEKSRKLDITEEVYFEIIRRKTASLIACSCAAGASSATDDDEIVKKMHKLGEIIGTAFQIKDDLMDYGSADIGKPRAIDIKEKKLTLPIIYTLSRVGRADRRKMLRTIKRHNTDEVRIKELVGMVYENGGIAYAEEAMHHLRNEASDCLSTLPANEATVAMEQLIDFVITRRR